MASKTKTRILQESLRLFKERGYNNVSVEDICASLGITRGTFYYHYKSKMAMLESIHSDQRDRSPEKLTALFSDDRLEQLWWLMDDSIKTTEALGSDLHGWLIAVSTTQKTGTFLPTRRTKDIIENVIAAGQRSGQFRNSSDPAVLTAAVYSIIMGVGREWCNLSGGFALRERIHSEVAAMLNVCTD